MPLGAVLLSPPQHPGVFQRLLCLHRLALRGASEAGRPQTLLLADLSNSFLFLPGWKVLFREPCDKVVSGFLRRWLEVCQVHARITGSRTCNHLAPSGAVPARGWKGEGVCSASELSVSPLLVDG